MATSTSVFMGRYERRTFIFLCILLLQADSNEARRIKSFTANGTDFRTRIDQPIVFPVGVNVTLKCKVSGKWLPSPIFILDRDERMLTGTNSLTDIAYTIHNIECMHRGPYHCQTRDHKDVRQVKMASIDLDVAGCPAQLCTNQSDHETVWSELGRTVSWNICIVGPITKPDYPKLKHQGFPSKNVLVVKKLDRRLDRNYGSRLLHFIEMTLENIQATGVGLMNITVLTDTNSWVGYTVDIKLLIESTEYDDSTNDEFRTSSRQLSSIKEITTKTVSNYSKPSKYFITSTTSRPNHTSLDQTVFHTATSLGQRSENTSSAPTHLIINVVLFVTLLIVVSLIVVYLVRRRVRRKSRLRQQEHHYNVVAPLSRHRDDDEHRTPPLPQLSIPQRPIVEATIVEPTSGPPPYNEILIHDYMAQRQSFRPYEVHYHLRDHNVVVYADDHDTLAHMSSEFCTTRLKQLASVYRSNHTSEADHIEHNVIPKTGYSERPESSVPSAEYLNYELDIIEPRPMSVYEEMV